MKNVIEDLNFFLKKYQTQVPLISFCIGFIFDLLTLGRVDNIFNLIQQGFYLFLCIMILILKYINHLPREKGFVEKIWKWRVFIFHFFLGALLSAYTIFYFKSASFGANSSFLIFICLLLIINEIEQFRKLDLYIKFGLLGICTFTYLNMLIPIWANELKKIYLFYAIVLTSSLFGLLSYFIGKKIKDVQKSLKDIFYPVLSAQGLVIILLAFNAIPPVPLSIVKMGVYQNVKKVDGDYELFFSRPFIKFWQKSEKDMMTYNGDKIYFFVSIFSPGNFKDKIYIRWELLENGEWKTSDRIPMEISGGREEGYRGVTYKSNYFEGELRIKVETKNERELGRMYFTVTKKNEDPPESRDLVKIIY